MISPLNRSYNVPSRRNMPAILVNRDDLTVSRNTPDHIVHVEFRFIETDEDCTDTHGEKFLLSLGLHKPSTEMASTAGFEPAIPTFGGKRSVQMSYRDVVLIVIAFSSRSRNPG